MSLFLLRRPRGRTIAQIHPVRDNAGEGGEVSEWPKERHWKCRVGLALPWVRIPPSPFWLTVRLLHF